MRPEKDRDWELPLGNDGVIVAVLLDIRDELKGLIHEITELTKIVAAHEVHQMEKNMVNLETAETPIERALKRRESQPSEAHPPSAPTPPAPVHKPPTHTVRRKS